MRIGMQTWGSDGDVRPFLALGACLRQRGHHVTVAVGSPDGKDYSAICAALGLHYVKAPAEIRVRQEGLLDRVGSGANVPRLMKVLLNEAYFPHVREMEAAARRLAESCDLLIGHFLCWPTRIAALKAGRRYASVCFWLPGVPGARRPPPGLPDLGPWLNRLGWRAAQGVLQRVVGPAYADMWRRHDLPVPPMIRGALSDTLNLVAASPLLCPGEQDHGPHRIVGHFRMPAEAEPPLPADLRAFLDAGSPPVFLSLGSTAMADADRAEALLVEAADLAQVRALIHLGPGRSPPRPSSEKVHFFGRLPHAPLLSRSIAAVHHGGAGTTHSVLEAGLPATVLAFMEEQYSWGRVLAEQGVGAAAFRYQKVRQRPQQVAEAIRRMVHDAELQERSRRLGARVAAHDGTWVATQWLERLGEGRLDGPVDLHSPLDESDDPAVRVA